MFIQDKLYLSFLYMSTKHAKITVSSSTPEKPVFNKTTALKDSYKPE